MGRRGCPSVTLTLFNFVFGVIGALFLTGALFFRFNAGWRSILLGRGCDLINFWIALGAAILFLSICGFVGCATKRKSVLYPYFFFVAVAVGTLFYASVMTWQFQSSMDSKEGLGASHLTRHEHKFLDPVARLSMNFYTRGGCTTIIPTSTNFTVQCDAPDSHWFQEFLNRECRKAFKSSSQGALVWNETKAAQCENALNASSTSSLSNAPQDAKIMFCTCQPAILKEAHMLSHSAGIFLWVITSILALPIAFVLLLCLLVLACNFRKGPSCHVEDDFYEALSPVDYGSARMTV